MGSFRSKEDDVSKISTFIPLKRSREGKRFGFVRFINVFNVERAPTNGNPKSGRPEHVKKDGGNNRNGAFTPRKGVGSMEKDDDCLYSKDLSKSLFGRVKEVASLSNLKKALINEGFDDLTIRYMGELWILLEFESVKSKDLFRDNTGAVSWFSVLRQASNDFMPEGRIVWVEVEEDLYFHSKRLCIYTKLRSNIFENFKIVYQGKVCWIHAKEVLRWVSKFLDDSNDENQSEEGINDHEPVGHDEHSCGDDNDVNEVAETLFDDSSGQKKNHSEDPFGFYPLLNKNKDDMHVNGTKDEQSIKYSPGFTPKAKNREFNLSEENVRSTNVDNLQPENDVEILDEQKDIHDVKGSNTQASVFACSGKFKRSAAPETGGSILCLLEELVKMGRTMGYNMEGCMNNMTEIIVSQGTARDSHDKRMLWDYLTHVSSQWDGEVVMMGDFNEVRFKSDRFGLVFNVHWADVFNSLIANAGLVEVPLGGSAFTWSHKSATKMRKVDRFLISDGLMNTCPNINVITLERYLSDHRPILFRESTYDYGPIPFRFYHHWLALDGFDNFVIDSWRNTPRDKSNAIRNLMYKLKFLKVRIRRWLSTNRNITKAEITRLIGELAKLDEVIDNGNATDDIVPRRLEVLNSIQNLNQIQAIEAAQKAKIKWSVEGDENYFQDRFDEPKDERVRIDMCFLRFLSNEQMDDLERMVSMEEVKRAVWDCRTDKSPGPDGFLFVGCNSAFITLIPKIPDANMVKDFRPISLIGSIYNIAAKILANRIVGVLGDIVNEVQSAFIAERQILDGPLNKRYSLKWRLWIQSCLRSSRGSIIVNGSPTKEFQFFKGLKQGMYTGIKLSSSLNLSYLFYADDVMFVGQWCDSNINILVHALECFHRASGLKMNISKSKILGIHVEAMKVKQAASKLGCLILNTHFSYLGTNVEGSMSRVHAWDEVVEKVTSRLSRWKMKTLSIGGRLTLLKSVLGSIPIFHMLIFKVPSSVLQRLESIQSRFFKGHDLGSNKASWVKWSNVLTPKEKGGLKVSGLYALNKDLLFKWVWKFYAQKSSLWARVIKAIHSVDGKMGKAINYGALSCWTSIVWEVEVLKQQGVNFFEYLQLNMGNGESTTFWEDRWLEGSVLKGIFPRLYVLETNKKVSVGDKLKDFRLDSLFRRKARGGIEQVQYEKLFDMVNSISLIPKNDRYVWSLSNSGDFSVASFRKVIDENRYPGCRSRTRWVKYVPIKVNVTAWKVKMDALPTRLNISQRDAYTYPPLPRILLSYQASACSLSTWHFLNLKLLENSVEVLKILENKLESMKILKNKLESLKLQENQPIDGLVPLFIKKFTFERVFERLLKKNHREEEDQEGNNSPEIETLTYHVLAIYGTTVAETELGERAETKAIDSVAEADVARGHGGDGGGDDRPPTHHIPTGCGGCFVNRGKGTRKPNLDRRKAGMLHTRQETRNLGLKKTTDDKGLVPIRFEWDDKKTMMPLGDHASHWSNYLGELIREMPLYYPSWQKVPAERKAAILTKIGAQFDLKPHMQSQRWTNINAGIQQHFQKLYNTNKASLKAAHWVINLDTGTYDVDSIRQRRTKPEPLKIAKTGQRARSYAGRDPGHLLAFEIRCSSTREYPSLIHTFFVTHTVGGVFVRDEDRALYDEMLRLQHLGSNTETGVPYTEEEIMAIVRKGKQWRHLPGVGRVRMTMRLFRSDNKFLQMLDQFESSLEFGCPNGNGWCGDDKPGGDEDEEDGDS
nr:RNA-directed DNA polymerase, eukaryota [Tanacetum cinerariifolium]